MFNILHSKSDSSPWTKSRLLKELFQDQGFSHQNSYHLIQPNDHIGVYISFEARNFPDRKDTVEMIASVFFQDKGGDTFTWLDLREIGTLVYGRKHSSLTIRKNEQLKQSDLYREFHETYLPFMKLLGHKKHLMEMVQGKEFALSGKRIKLRSIDEFDVVRRVLDIA